MSSTQISIDQAMWNEFVIKINEALGNPGLTAETYVPASGQSPANWELLNTTGTVPGIPGTIIVDYLESWCNNMPIWGSSYMPGSSLYDNYSLFLYSLVLGTPGDPAQQQIADLWSQQVQTSQSKINQYNIDSASAWNTFNSEQQNNATQLSYNDWYNKDSEGPNKPNGPSWATTISNEEATKENALKEYEITLEKVGGEGYEELSNAIASLKLSESAGNVLTDTAGVLWPKYSVSPGLNDWFLKALPNENGKPLIDFNIDIKEVDLNSTTKSEYLSSGEAPFIFSGNDSGSVTQTELIKEMEMSYKAQDAKLFSVNPGSWFDVNFMNNFKSKNEDNTYLVSPNSALYGKDLFGPNGVINLRTLQILAVYRPSVTLKGSTSEVSTLKNAVGNSGNISVAGVSIKASDLETTSSSEVIVKANDNTPEVIGIVPKKLG